MNKSSVGTNVGAPQPAPVGGNSDDPVFVLVMQDLASRARVGKTKYGTYLYPFNGRNALIDAYQEQLDGAQYIRQAIYEMDRVRDAARQILDLLAHSDIVVKANSQESADDFQGALNVLDAFVFRSGENNNDRD